MDASHPQHGAVIALVMLLAAAGCGGGQQGPAEHETQGGPPMTISLESTAFQAGQPIPKKHTGDGADVSPPLAWSGVPDEARELALICDDPDAPTPEPWVHWVIYKIPATVTALPEAVPATESISDPTGAKQGKNTWPTIGYRGPAPPRGHGVHHYHFRLYALDRPLDVPSGLDKKQLLAKMKGRILAEGELVGTYRR